MPKLPKLRILALDPATKCGWAHSCGASGTWDLSVRRDESGGMRLIRLKAKLSELLEGAGIDLIAYEAARNAMPKMQGALVVQSMIQSVIVVWAEENKIDYRGYSPSEIKKFATGNGNAGKDKVLAMAREIWGNVEDDNQADALWLLALAKRDLGL